MTEDEEDREVEAWSNTLDELDARAVATVESGDPRQIAAAHWALAEHIAGIVDSEVVIDILLTAREAYEEFDAAEAAKCAVSIGTVAYQASDLDTAFDAFSVAAEEFLELRDMEQFADAANTFGALALQLGEYAAAEDALGDAIEVYRDRAQPNEAAEAMVNLSNVYRMSGRPELAEKQLKELSAWFVAESAVTESAGATGVGADGAGSLRKRSCDQSLAGLYVETGRPHLALPLLERSLRDAEQYGSVDEALESRMNLGLVLIYSGQADRGEALMKEARSRFLEGGHPEKAAACDYNLAFSYSLRGAFGASDDAFKSAAKGLYDSGQFHQLANLQWNRVKRLFLQATAEPAAQPTLAAEAVDTAISALIAADYQRFQYVDARRRAEWTQKLDHRLTWTFLTAYKLGSKVLMADLIESAINVGVYGSSDGGVDDFVPFDPTSVSQPSATDRSGDLAESLGGAATLLGSAVLPLSPPPILVGGDGRVILARQREMAASLDPRIGDHLANAPQVAAW
ncbi:tetratricopeptide repeat protein [Gordonia sp. (in: high G+C Gram-positive bacteria)]|uniref:tetratricopeptide repeat protein n=1 Tax=Gordonia sp. (in: high G+C Gram-positive bacteria) TaxID=84139 RepID=UPI003C730022